MLKGFIDLVFRHEGRYYLLDYKSNWLGENSEAYTQQAMASAMQMHRYDLQSTSCIPWRCIAICVIALQITATKTIWRGDLPLPCAGWMPPIRSLIGIFSTRPGRGTD